MPSPLVEGVSAKTPQLALHLGGYGECTYQFFARAVQFFPQCQQSGQHSHGGVPQIGAGGVIQLQLVAADTVQERRISRGKASANPRQSGFPGPRNNPRSFFYHPGTAAKDHSPHSIQDGAGAEVDLLLAQRYRMLNKVCKGF